MGPLSSSGVRDDERVLAGAQPWLGCLQYPVVASVVALVPVADGRARFRVLQQWQSHENWLVLLRVRQGIEQNPAGQH